MIFSNFCFILTDACNFNCSYCFQTRTDNYIKDETIKKAVDFFYPFFETKTSIIFFGGEPLLAFDKIRYTISLLEDKNASEEKTFKYFLTTNGSLMTPEILAYFAEKRFDLMLSFDGITQESARKKDSLESTRKLINRLRETPNITFSTNSVFDTRSIHHMTESIEFVLECGAKEIMISIDSYSTWDREAVRNLELQYEKLNDFILEYYKTHGTIPVRFLRPAKEKHQPGQFFVCGAGRHRMSINPNGEIYGCFLFHDYLQKRKDNEDYATYAFGTLDHFIENHETLYPEIMENYNDLRQDRFIAKDKFCFTCDYLEHCKSCPVSGAYATDMIGKFDSQMCTLNQLKHQAKQNFLEKLDKLPAVQK